MFKIAYSDKYCHPLPEGHRFPMDKYELIPHQLLYEGLIEPENLFEPEPLPDEIILAVHQEEYWLQLKKLQIDASHIRRIGFPLSAELVLRESIISSGTLACALHALKYGVSINVAGGTHHAFSDKGEGFCLLNDMAIAARYLLETKQSSRILIIDLDVHQGNGTASIFKNEPAVFTFSMHGGDNFPFKKEKSSLDIPLENGTGDFTYLFLLEKNLDEILSTFKPDFVFYLSGVDILETDKLGKLRITENGCKKRDAMVFEKCKSAKIPVAVAMGGGYSPKISDIVSAHCNTFRSAIENFF